MNPTEIDDLLHRHGTRWIESQPPPPALDAAVGAAKGVSRSRIRYLAVAACVLAVLGVAAIPLARTPGADPIPPNRQDRPARPLTSFPKAHAYRQ